MAGNRVCLRVVTPRNCLHTTRAKRRQKQQTDESPIEGSRIHWETGSAQRMTPKLSEAGSLNQSAPTSDESVSPPIICECHQRRIRPDRGVMNSMSA